MAEKTIAESIEENAKSPASVSLDGSTITSKTVDQQIMADRYTAGKAAGTTKRTGLRFFTLKDNRGY